MNQSDLRAMRERLQARQAAHYSAGGLIDAVVGVAAMIVFFLIVMFI